MPYNVELVKFKMLFVRDGGSESSSGPSEPDWGEVASIPGVVVPGVGGSEANSKVRRDRERESDSERLSVIVE